jgi:hypothetical protein
LKRLGRPPIGRKAMTGAQRQARHREKLRQKQAERRRLQAGKSARAYQPPHGYQQAKDKLIAQGHVFTRVHDDLGREFGGVFVDGAYVSTHEVITLAELSAQERRQRLTEERRKTKNFACEALEAYMEEMQVSREELAQYFAAAPCGPNGGRRW